MQKPTKLKWYCNYNPSKLGYDLFFLAQFGDGNPWCYVTEMLFDEQDPSKHSNPLFVFNEDQAQELIDALWEAGLRPTKESDTIDAVKSHLEDMRTIVFQSPLPVVKINRPVDDTFTFTFTVDGKTTIPIPCNASSAVMQAALDALRAD